MADGKLSRRRFIAGAAGASIGIAVGAGAAAAADRAGPLAIDDSAAANAPIATTVPFLGEHQAGIATPAQDRMSFAAFDLTTGKRDDVVALLRAWTAAAERMCAGETALDLGSSAVPAPPDSGEALGLAPARLTVTFGFGPGLFARDGVDRYSLASARPDALADIPPFAGDALDPGRSGGDLCVQACADDPQVAFHAVRNLGRIARDIAVMRWSQQGFGRTSSTSRAQETPRNLMGFKDGTNNIEAEDDAAMRDFVWVADEGPAWMRGGSYLVARRIRIRIEAWDRDSLGDQEARVGRQKLSGAPLGAAAEHDVVDLAAMSGGRPVIPANAHIRLASHANNDGARILRRGYSFADGADEIGQLDAGLFFICYQRDVRSQFIPIQAQLAAQDALNLYLVPTGSAAFACPSGVQAGDWIGSGLFA